MCKIFKVTDFRFSFVINEKIISKQFPKVITSIAKRQFLFAYKRLKVYIKVQFIFQFAPETRNHKVPCNIFNWLYNIFRNMATPSSNVLKINPVKKKSGSIVIVLDFKPRGPKIISIFIKLPCYHIRFLYILLYYCYWLLVCCFLLLWCTGIMVYACIKC